MKFHNNGADLFVPDGESFPRALSRTTRMGIGAHQDDVEIIGYHGIAECYAQRDRWFGAVTCTNGAGSSRTGIYAEYTDEQMVAVRRDEQRKAAVVGQYSAVAQLDYESSTIRDPGCVTLKEDLSRLLEAARPEVIYTHNPADKHPTHIAVVVAVIAALREMSPAARPAKVYGCEVWRDLDWLRDESKVALDVSPRVNLAHSLIGLFDSQISGGKRYDLATFGRWQANATYFDPHRVDKASLLAFAMDLTPLVRDPALDVAAFVLDHIDAFRADVEESLRRHLDA